MEREKQQILRNKIETLEEQITIDKAHISELESCLKLIIAFKSLDPKLHRVLNDLFHNTTTLIRLRTDRLLESKALSTKEQRYHTLNKANVKGL